MADRRPAVMFSPLSGATLRLATDEAPEASAERQRMSVALDAARTLERAIDEGVVSVGFAALRTDSADPLAVEVTFSIGRNRQQDADLWPVFAFNLRDAYVDGTKDGASAHAINGVERLAQALDSLLAQMRRNLNGVYRGHSRSAPEASQHESHPRAQTRRPAPGLTT